MTKQDLVAYLKSHIGGCLWRGKEDTRTGEGHREGFNCVCIILCHEEKGFKRIWKVNINWLWYMGHCYIIVFAGVFQTVSSERPFFPFTSNPSQTDMQTC